MAGERLIIRAPGYPEPEVVETFQQVTGTRLIGAMRVFAAAPYRGTRDFVDGTELVFTDVDPSRVNREALRLLDATHPVLGSDAIDRYTKQNPPSQK